MKDEKDKQRSSNNVEILREITKMKWAIISCT
jgi:hypothetical protein